MGLGLDGDDSVPVRLSVMGMRNITIRSSIPTREGVAMILRTEKGDNTQNKGNRKDKHNRTIHPLRGIINKSTTIQMGTVFEVTAASVLV